MTTASTPATLTQKNQDVPVNAAIRILLVLLMVSGALAVRVPASSSSRSAVPCLNLALAIPASLATHEVTAETSAEMWISG